MANFVLVHGAWHGGWCWSRVRDILGNKGHRVFTPTLTGLADRSHLLSPAINLDTHIEDVANLILWEDLDRVVLCGHSYAGMLIPGIAERVAGRLAAVVYLDALMPEDGQSVMDILGPALLGPQMPDQPAYAPPPVSLLALEGADAAWVESKVTPQPAGTVLQPVRCPDVYQRTASKTYILANKVTPHPLFAGSYERCAQDPTWSAIKMGAGHDVMVEDPVGLSALLEGLA